MEKTIHSEAYIIVRNWLIQKRKEKNFTQRDLASRLNVPHSWVGKIETSERRLDFVEFIRLCKALDADPCEGIALCIESVE